ncbi:MAG: M14 family zinc carboxypeptidase, partial [Acidobacteriota bacterium]
MTTTLHRRSLRGYLALGVTTALVVSAVSLTARQAKPVVSKGAQVNDAEYTKRILDNTPDKRILTEFVDHLPASATVPSPLKALGYIPGENGNITYSADIYKYLDSLVAASPRMKCWSIGKTEEGRDTRACAIADEATIKALDKYKQITAQLTDPRKTTDAQAKMLIATGKPIYWATGSIHSGETGSPEMLMELAYRLVVEESPFIQQIRNN